MSPEAGLSLGNPWRGFKFHSTNKICGLVYQAPGYAFHSQRSVVWLSVMRFRNVLDGPRADLHAATTIRGMG
jgi:hypothetical protein